MRIIVALLLLAGAICEFFIGVEAQVKLIDRGNASDIDCAALDR